MATLSKISKIKKLIKEESLKEKGIPRWFFSAHLEGVEKFAKILLKRFPAANKEVVMLAVWLHDLQRIRGLKGDHAKVGAGEAEKVLKSFKYPSHTVLAVKEVILTHCCDKNNLPRTVEGKILACADAMAHYINDFYLLVALTGKRNLSEYKDWALKKIKHDYTQKICFPFARKLIAEQHKIILKFLTKQT